MPRSELLHQVGALIKENFNAINHKPSNLYHRHNQAEKVIKNPKPFEMNSLFSTLQEDSHSRVSKSVNLSRDLIKEKHLYNTQSKLLEKYGKQS
jgi:hypothetical protein